MVVGLMMARIELPGVGPPDSITAAVLRVQRQMLSLVVPLHACGNLVSFEVLATRWHHQNRI
jgi:hypothetical protein